MLRFSIVCALLIVMSSGVAPLAFAQDRSAIVECIKRMDELFRNKRYREVEVEFERGYSIAPSEPRLHLLRGRALTMMKRYDEAEAVLHWVEQVWVSPEAQWALGEAYILQEKWPEAVKAYEASIEMVDPVPCAVYLNLGTACWRMGDTERALRYLKLARELSPDDQNLADTIAKFTREASVQGKYKTKETEYFSISFEADDDQTALQDKMGHLLESALSDVARDLWYPKGGKLQVVLYPDPDSARMITGTPEWVQASFDGKLRIPLQAAEKDQNAFVRILRHELTHLLLAHRFGNQMPGWLNEGLAQSHEGSLHRGSEWHFKKMLAGELPMMTLTSLERASFTGFSDVQQAHSAYSESLFAVMFLKERWYQNAPVDILQEMTGGGNVESALRKVTGMDYPEFMREMILHYKKSYGIQ